MTSDELRNTAKDTAASVQDATSRAAGAASASGAKMVGGANDAGDRVQDAVGAAYQNVKARMPDSTASAVDAGKRAYAQGSDHVGRQVSRQPIEALLLAGAIGYLVGWATNRS